MSASDDKDKKKPPEWHLFDRLDEVEDITLELMDKIKTTETTRNIASDAYGIAMTVFVFIAAISRITIKPFTSEGAKELTNELLSTLDTHGVSSDSIASVEAMLKRMYDVN